MIRNKNMTLAGLRNNAMKLTEVIDKFQHCMNIHYSSLNNYFEEKV